MYVFVCCLTLDATTCTHRQAGDLAQLCPSTDLQSTLLPIVRTLLSDAFAKVRSAARKQVSVSYLISLITRTHSTLFHQIGTIAKVLCDHGLDSQFRELLNTFAISPSFQNRQMFASLLFYLFLSLYVHSLSLCDRVVRMCPDLVKTLGWVSFGDKFFGWLIDLGRDSVPNVRFAVSEVLKDPAFSQC